MKKIFLTLSLFLLALVGMNGVYAQTTKEISVTSEVPADRTKNFIGQRSTRLWYN